jgi:DNA-binding CsgD family transcriptional regulator
MLTRVASAGCGRKGGLMSTEQPGWFPTREEAPAAFPTAVAPLAAPRAFETVGDYEAELVRNCIPWGVLVVGEDCQILLSNPRGQSFLRAGSGLDERNGKLRLERSSSDRSLRELVQWASAPAQAPTDPPSGSNTLGVPGHDGRIRFAVRVVPSSQDGAQRTALVIIADLASTSHMDRVSAMRVFRLSAREAHFAELFAAGNRIEAIASAMGVTPNTARVHLRHVFAKTGCSNQIELARKFACIP